MRKKPDMLNQGNKIIKLLFIILVINSCNDKEIVNYEQFSRNIIGDVFYNQFSKQVNDSINLWCNRNLENYQFLCVDKWELDKTICFNKEKDKCVMSLNIQCTRNTCKAEDMHFFYGVKIKDTWFFFIGATIYLPREMYQKDITKPLSFEKLHEIALKEVFSGYLKKKEPIVPFWKFWVEQEYEIDESWFDSHFDISDLGYDDDSQKRIFKQFKDSISQPFKKRDSFEEYYFKNISNPYLFK